MGDPILTLVLWESFGTLCNQLAAKAGIEKRVHPHGFWHGWALGQVQAGVSLNAIQALLGHRSLHTTSVYLQHAASTSMPASLPKTAVWPPHRRPQPHVAPRRGSVPAAWACHWIVAIYREDEILRASSDRGSLYVVYA